MPQSFIGVMPHSVDALDGRSSTSTSSTSSTSTTTTGTTLTTTTATIEETDACDQCPDGVPLCWEFAIAGITNNGCESCDEINGTYIIGPLVANPAVCGWAVSSNGPDEVCASTIAPKWLLEVDTTDTFDSFLEILTNTLTTVITYRQKTLGFWVIFLSKTAYCKDNI